MGTFTLKRLLLFLRYIGKTCCRCGILRNKSTLLENLDMIHQIVLVAKLDDIPKKLFAGDSGKRVFEDSIEIARRAALEVYLLFRLGVYRLALLYMLHPPRNGVSHFIFLHTG